jgi:hypothetical protein
MEKKWASMPGRPSIGTTPCVSNWDFDLVVDIFGKSGYILARMRYEIVLAPEAVDDFKHLAAGDRSTIREAIKIHSNASYTLSWKFTAPVFIGDTITARRKCYRCIPPSR